MDPVLAANVVKKYLLPMFEKKNMFANNANRKQIMGLGRNELLGSRDSTAETTVYEELKLSEKLLMELEVLNSKVTKADQSAATFEQEKYELVSEIKILQEENSDLILNAEMFKLQLNQQTKNSHTSEMKLYFVYKQLEHYKKLHKVSEEKLREVSNDLYEVRHTNDIRLQN